MSLVVTPAQLARRAEFYQQLSQLLAAGFPMVQTLEHLRANPPHPSFCVPLDGILARLSKGASFAEALGAVGSWIPIFDIALLGAGETSGQLPNCFKLLAEYYGRAANLARQAIAALLYPAALFHFAIFIGPFPAFMQGGDLQAYAMQTFGVLIPIYIIIGVLVYAAQGSHGECWRAGLERVGRAIPVLGSARRSLALARLAAALEALLNAGVPVVQAWEMSANASGSPALKRTVLAWRPGLMAGQTPADLLIRSPVFPEVFANLYQTGEISGQLDESLQRLHNYYQEEGARKLQALAVWVPKLIYLAIMLLIAWRIVSFWKAHFDQLGDVLNNM
jgi:type II secretory pathway component PulF